MKSKQWKSVVFGSICIGVLWGGVAQADDLSDGISEYSDESIAAEGGTANKDTNVSFIVQEALTKAKASNKGTENNSGGLAESSSATPKDKVNLDDGTSENNENSVVLQPGAKADKIYNIILAK